MTPDINELQKALCKSFCADVRLKLRGDDIYFVNTPLSFPDGDAYTIYLRLLTSGLTRITDDGHTLMHLSYDNDVSKIRSGTRGTLLERIKAEMDLHESNGELFMDCPIDKAGETLFRFGQALTKITDLTFLNRAKVESTFYDDLWEALVHIIRAEIITRDYLVPDMPKAEDYPIDYKIERKMETPFFVFGIPNKDKARLVTIIIEHLLREKKEFDSLLIFDDQQGIPRPDLARLSNVGGEMVASLDAQSDLRRKLLKMAV
jgi:hypothetical protein